MAVDVEEGTSAPMKSRSGPRGGGCTPGDLQPATGDGTRRSMARVCGVGVERERRIGKGREKV